MADGAPLDFSDSLNSLPTRSGEGERTITSPLGKQDGDALNEIFDGYWKEIPDAESPEPTPSAPVAPAEKPEKPVDPDSTEGPVEVTYKEVPKAKKPKPAARPPSVDIIDTPVGEDPKEPVAAEVKSPKVEPVDLDSLEPHPSASEENKSHFKQLKESAKHLRDQNAAKDKRLALYEKVQPELKELPLELVDADEARQQEAAERIRASRTSLDPATAAELEGYRTTIVPLARGTALEKSLTYNRQYVQPLQNCFVDLMSDIVANVTNVDPQQKPGWQNEILTKHVPEHFFLPNSEGKNIGEQWFAEQLARIPNGIDRQRIINKVVTMSNLLKERDRVKGEILQNGNMFQQWAQVEAQQQQLAQEQQQKYYVSEVRNESDVTLDTKEEYREYKELRDRTVDQKGDVKPDASEEDKKAWGRLSRDFTTTLDSINKSPRKATVTVMENIMLKDKVKKIPTLEKELAAANHTIAYLRGETKIKRKIKDVPMNGGHPSPTTTPAKTRLSDLGGRGGLEQSFRDNLI